MTSWQALESCIGTCTGAGLLVFTGIVTTIAGMLVALYHHVFRLRKLSAAARVMTASAAGAVTITFTVVLVLAMTHSLALSTLLFVVGGLAFGYIVGHVAFLAGRAKIFNVAWRPFDLFEAPEIERPSSLGDNSRQSPKNGNH
jgi:hypothetical protein